MPLPVGSSIGTYPLNDGRHCQLLFAYNCRIIILMGADYDNDGNVFAVTGNNHCTQDYLHSNSHRIYRQSLALGDSPSTKALSDNAMINQ